MAGDVRQASDGGKGGASLEEETMSRSRKQVRKKGAEKTRTQDEEGGEGAKTMTADAAASVCSRVAATVD